MPKRIRHTGIWKPYHRSSASDLLSDAAVLDAFAGPDSVCVICGREVRVVAMFGLLGDMEADALFFNCNLSFPGKPPCRHVVCYGCLPEAQKRVESIASLKSDWRVCMATYRGRTEDGMGIILGASWWETGKKIFGKVLGSFETENGTCYQLTLAEPVEIDGQKVKLVAVGALRGFHAAMSAAGLGSLEEGDGILLECTGKTETQKGSPMVNFYLEVVRA